jgi:hypothetical protein
MQTDVIRFNGSYRYADRATLEHALNRARTELADDELESDRAWLRCFVMSGTSLIVNLVVQPDSEERFAAANVFLILAHDALEGAVEARHGDSSLDMFPSGLED